MVCGDVVMLLSARRFECYATLRRSVSSATVFRLPQSYNDNTAAGPIGRICCTGNFAFILFAYLCAVAVSVSAVPCPTACPTVSSAWTESTTKS